MSEGEYSKPQLPSKKETRVVHVICTKNTAEYMSIEVTTTNQLGVTNCVGWERAPKAPSQRKLREYMWQCGNLDHPLNPGFPLNFSLYFFVPFLTFSVFIVGHAITRTYFLPRTLSFQASYSWMIMVIKQNKPWPLYWGPVKTLLRRPSKITKGEIKSFVLP